MEKIKILILTAPYGNGHLSVANGMIEEFSKHAHVETFMYDIYSEDYPKINSFVKKFYLKTYKKGFQQQAYRFFYYGSEKLIDLKLAKPYVRFGIRKLIKKIAEVNPQIIINTFPVTCTYKLCEENIDIPFYTVITDYYANYNWMSKNARIHFLSSPIIIDQLKARGYDDSTYEMTGIPVKPVFYEEYTDEQIQALKEKFEIIDGKKVILLVAGAHGVIPKFSKLVEAFTGEDHIQLLVVCGKNKKLYHQLSRYSHKNLKVFEFVNNIHEMMRVSDVLITKPGGITLTEAANIGIPAVLYRPVYGQELENAMYFSSKRAAAVALLEDELVYKTLNILNDSQLLAEMKENIKKIAIKYSASLIVEKMLEDYQQYIEEQHVPDQVEPAPVKEHGGKEWIDTVGQACVRIR